MNKFKLASGVFLIFLVGALAGSLAAGVYFKHRIKQYAAGGPPARARAALLMDKLSDKLNLNETQRIEIEQIINDAQQEMFAVRRRVSPEIQAINQNSFDLIKDKLDNKQKEKLDALNKRIEGLRDKLSIQLILSEKSTERVLADMKDRLKLTQGQEENVREILEESIEKRKEIIGDSKEKNRPELPSLRRKMHELDQSVENRLSGILSEKQLEEYRRIQKEERLEQQFGMNQRKIGGKN